MTVKYKLVPAGEYHACVLRPASVGLAIGKNHSPFLHVLMGQIRSKAVGAIDLIEVIKFAAEPALAQRLELFNVET